MAATAHFLTATGRPDRLVGGAASPWATVDRALSRPVIWSVAVATVILLQMVLTLSHWPWLDEYQALQIAVQSPDLTALFGNLRYEGHPPLWYLMLRAAATVLPAGWILAGVAAPLAVLIQAIILFRTPFARSEQLLLATSAFILFEYGAVARSLTLGVLLLLAAFAFRERRWSWFALALLPMADFLFGVLSVVLIAIQWRERRLCWPGLVGWALMGVLAAVSVHPAADMVPAFRTSGLFADLGEWLNRLSILLLPLQLNGWRPEWNQTLPLGLASVAGPLFLVFALRQLREDGFATLLLVGFLLLTAAFSIIVYPLAIRHLTLIALLLIVLIWRHVERGGVPDRWFRPWLIGLSIGGLTSTAAALVQPFDTAPIAAQAIRQAGLEHAHWISFPDSRGQGISALTGMPFHKLGRDCRQTFIRWNYQSRIRTPGALSRALRQVVDRYGRVQLLTDLPIEQYMDPHFVRPLASVPAGYDGQAFYLYTVGPTLPPSTLRPPPCVAGNRPFSMGR